MLAGPSRDDLVGSGQDRLRDRKAKRLRGFRLSVAWRLTSPRHELMVGAFGDVVPGADQRLELREGRMALPGHGCLLGFFFDDLCRQLLEIVKHRQRELENLDLTLEFSL